MDFSVNGTGTDNQSSGKKMTSSQMPNKCQSNQIFKYKNEIIIELEDKQENGFYDVVTGQA